MNSGPLRLTALTRGSGCACKLGMAELEGILGRLTPVTDPRVLIDASSGDDAAVWRLDPPREPAGEGGEGPTRVLVATTDFFPPMVDDARDFGRIAAANALSDLYAMGAEPLFALNLVAFPRERLPTGLLDEILEGVGAVAAEAGVPIVGGHSVDDPEPKVGLVAIGETTEGALIRNDAARPGDLLILTKAIGTGVITTALKRSAEPDSDPELQEALAGAVASMTTLNRGGASLAVSFGVRAGTDVTGFGLLGHLSRMLRASGTSATVEAAAVPTLPGAEAFAGAGHLPDGTLRNFRDLQPFVSFGAAVPELLQLLLHDAQTSGGLLLAVPRETSDALLGSLPGRAPFAAVIGRVEAGEPGTIRVV